MISCQHRLRAYRRRRILAASWLHHQDHLAFCGLLTHCMILGLEAQLFQARRAAASNPPFGWRCYYAGSHRSCAGVTTWSLIMYSGFFEVALVQCVSRRRFFGRSKKISVQVSNVLLLDVQSQAVSLRQSISWLFPHPGLLHNRVGQRFPSYNIYSLFPFPFLPLLSIPSSQFCFLFALTQVLVRKIQLLEVSLISRKETVTSPSNPIFSQRVKLSHHDFQGR